jgi:CRP/FNR family transcriptional regulator, cyclic AMP receptor protein
MITWNSVGYLASGLVLAAFCMKEMFSLRLVAVCSNVAFLIYGLALDLAPVWLLHAMLLPINCWRLWQCLFLEGPESISAISTRQPPSSQKA